MSMKAEETAVGIAMDAFRIAIGHKPRKWDVEWVVIWLRLMAKLRRGRGPLTKLPVPKRPNPSDMEHDR